MASPISEIVRHWGWNTQSLRFPTAGPPTPLGERKWLSLEKTRVGHCGRIHVRKAGVRDPWRRTKPLRGGKDPGLVHKPSASATRPIDSDFAPCLYQRAAPCYSSAWLRLAAASVRFFTSRSPGTLPRTRPLPIYSIYIKAKAVPVAASSSEIASARPMGPEFRPRSFTALRIQHSSEGRSRHRGLYHHLTL